MASTLSNYKRRLKAFHAGNMEFVVPLPMNNTDQSLSYRNWKSLQQRFNDYCESQLKNCEHSQTDLLPAPSSIFLHFARGEINEIFTNYISIEKFGENTVNAAMVEIENRCLPSFILLYERFKFFTHKQNGPGEIGKFISELKWLAEYCELQEQKEKFVLNRVTNGVQSPSLHKQLQNIENLDLDKAIKICCAADDLILPNSIAALGKKKMRKKAMLPAKENQNIKSEENTSSGPSTRAKSVKKIQTDTIITTVQTSEHDGSGDAIEMSSKSLRSKNLCQPTSNTRSNYNGIRNKKAMKARRQHKTKRILSSKYSSTLIDSVSLSPQNKSELGLQPLSSVPSTSSISLSCQNDLIKKETYIPDDNVMIKACKMTNRIAIEDDTYTFQTETSNKEKVDIMKLSDFRRKNTDYKEENSNSTTSSEIRRSKKCPICGTMFPTMYLLKCHMRVHSGRRLYKCEICDMSFIHSGTRSRHMRQSHPEMLKFKCDECNMLFELQTALNLHKLSHSREEEIPCEDCGKIFMSTRDHYHHRRKEHRNTRYSCDICGLHFPYPSKLKLHLMTKHDATKPFMCEICGTSFAEKNMLANHKNIHSGEKKHECNKCGRKFLLKTTLNNHMQTHLDHKPHTCDICGMNFKLSYYLKSHMKTHSNNRERPHVCSTCGAAFFKSGQLRNHERKHTGEKPYKCEICNAAFSQLSSMNKHVKQIHEGLKPKDKFSCEFCGLSFTHSCKLKLHLMKHTGERPFECKICGSTYRENHQLTSHMKVHNGNEPFKCDICGRRFLQKSYLEGHVRKHTGEKPFKCPICNAGFTQKGYLRDHIKVHDQNRERKYKCSLCGKAFTCSSHMRSHEKLHSGEKPHKCDLCGSRFTKRSSVKKHLKRSHGVTDVASQQAQTPDPSTVLVTQTIQDQSGLSIAQLQPVEISLPNIETDLHPGDMPNQPQLLCSQSHSELNVQLQPELAGKIRADTELNVQMHAQLGSKIGSDLQPQLQDMNVGLHTVHASIHQQMHQHPTICILHPELHSGIQAVHSQMHPVMNSDGGVQIQHSDIVQEIQVYNTAS